MKRNRWVPIVIFSAMFIFQVSADTLLTDCNDSNLRAAIAAGGRITFSCDGIIELSAPLMVNATTEIDGTGRQVTISGGGSNRLFTVTNTTLRLYNLTLANGKETGAATTGSNDFFNFVITAHSTPGYGGAIKSENSSLTISGCILSNNIAHGGQGIPYQGAFEGNAASPGEGGAIFATNSTLNITNSLFINNRAEGGGFTGCCGEIRVGSASGGAVAAYNTTTQIADSEFKNNDARAGSGVDATDEGQPAYGGALYFKGGNATIVETKVSANLATATGGKASQSTSAWGGGIYAEAILSLSNCSIEENTAWASLGRPGGDAVGGGLASFADLTITGSLIRANRTLAGSSAVPAVFPIGPGGAPLGGGVAIYGSATLVNSTCAENYCFEAEAKASDSGHARGAGLYVASTNVQLRFLTIARNGLAVNTDSSPGAQGSGLCVATNGTAELAGTLFAANFVFAQHLPQLDPDFYLTVASTNDLFGNFLDSGHNLCSDNSLLTNSTSLTNVDPILGSLGFHGGATATISLLAGSPAIDAGGTANLPARDQRGRSRVYGSAADIGAYESSAPYYVAGTIVGATDTIRLTIGSNTNSSAVDNTFEIPGVAAGQQVLTPVIGDFIFDPINIPLNITTDVEGLSFRAYRLNGFTLEKNTNGQWSMVYASDSAGTYRIENSENLKNWNLDQSKTLGQYELFSIPLTPDSGRKYYRALRN